MNARERKKLLHKIAEGYTVTEKKRIRQIRDGQNGEPSKVIVEEEFERYIPPNLQALELLYSGNPRRHKER